MRFDRLLSGQNNFWDRTGVAVSWLCAVHCLLLPFLISLLPLAGLGFLADERTETIFIALSVIVASLSLVPGFFKYHRRLNTLLLFIAGLAFVVVADPLFEENFWGKAVFVACGAALISAAHLVNRRLCRNCRACAETDCRL